MEGSFCGGRDPGGKRKFIPSEYCGWVASIFFLGVSAFFVVQNITANRHGLLDVRSRSCQHAWRWPFPSQELHLLFLSAGKSLDQVEHRWNDKYRDKRGG